jgi:uncharacterized membrane protein YqjE
MARVGGTDGGARPPGTLPLGEVPTRALVGALADRGRALLREELGLARAELRAELRQEARAAAGLGIAALCALLTLALLLVAAVLALMEGGVLPGWAAALVFAALLLALGTAAGLWGWARHVRRPLEATRRSLGETARFARERLA